MFDVFGHESSGRWLKTDGRKVDLIRKWRIKESESNTLGTSKPKEIRTKERSDERY